MKSYRVREQQHDDLLAHLLLARGIAPEAHDAFINPNYDRDQFDPYLLPDMAPAVDRLFAALSSGEHVAVWSDYDCDGVPGGVMLADFFRTMGLKTTHYIPHRHKEGYGLNSEGLEELRAQGVTLVVTVDLGTTEVVEVAWAKEHGIDMIITDHHLVQQKADQVETSIAQRDGASIANSQQGIMRARRDFGLPDAVAVINPKRPDSAYPFDGLCGAGVAWKLVQAVLARDRSILGEGQEKWMLDLVGIATLSDMVPLVGENRMLAHSGLKVLRRARRPGLAALLKLLRINAGTLVEDDITFMVSPRINAASRMDTPHLAARLLASTEAAEAADLAAELNHINDERKGLVAATVKEANKRMLERGMQESPVIVMGSPAWRPGILGLVANSLVEAHQKPVFLWGREGGEELRGSCRSDGRVNVVELMGLAHRATAEGAGPLFSHFGGHFASGGFSVLEEHAHNLLPRLSAAHAAVASVGDSVQEVVVDRELTLGEMPHAHAALKKMAPFGVGNTKPLFIFPRVTIAGTKTFGKTQNHIGATLGHGATRAEAIAFFAGADSFNKKIAVGEIVDVVGHVEAGWRGGPRIRIIDII